MDEHLVVALLLPSAHDLIALASSQKDIGWSRKRKLFLKQTAILLMQFCLENCWFLLLGGLHPCVLSTLLLDPKISISSQEGFQPRCVVQPEWTMLVFCSVSSGCHLGEWPFFLTLPTFGAHPLKQGWAFCIWCPRRMISALEENRMLQKFMK